MSKPGQVNCFKCSEFGLELAKNRCKLACNNVVKAATPSTDINQITTKEPYVPSDPVFHKVETKRRSKTYIIYIIVASASLILITAVILIIIQRKNRNAMRVNNI